MQDYQHSPYFIYTIISIISFILITLLFYNQFVRSIEGDIGEIRPFQSVGDRGNIYLTDHLGKKHLVATTNFEYNLIISPIELGDVEEIYEHINEGIPINKKDFFEQATKGGIDQYEIIKKKVDEETKNRIENRIKNYSLKGVRFEALKKRKYVYDSLAAHVIGFVSVDNEGKTRGQYGIESIYDRELSRANNKSKELDDVFKEQLININRQTIGSSNITLTIDINIERELEKKLEEINKKWSAQNTGGIIMNPHTGEILAMASYPTFNPNKFNKVKNYLIFNNSNIENVYEMGSVFKALTVAIGLDSKKIDITLKYNDRGKVNIDGRTISNFDSKGRGPNTPLQKILSQSLNTGAVFILQKIGIGVYKDYIDKFRFDGTTIIDLPKESIGLVSNLNSNRLIEFATASFGQGIAVTPIAATRAFASLANGGFVVQPFVTKSIDKTTIIKSVEGTNNMKEVKRIFSEKTTKEVTDLLVKAYESSYAGSVLKHPRYSVAAKTGTAQLVNPNTGKYYDDKYFHSYFGYFPASRPEYIIFLYTVDPKAEYASETLAVPFSDLTNYIVSHFNVKPDR